MIIEYIPEKWRNLRLEYTDEYINYRKEKKLKKKLIHEPKIMKKPIKKSESILKNKLDVNKESHRCKEICVNNKHKCIVL